MNSNFTLLCYCITYRLLFHQINDENFFSESTWKIEEKLKLFFGCLLSNRNHISISNNSIIFIIIIIINCYHHCQLYYQNFTLTKNSFSSCCCSSSLDIYLYLPSVQSWAIFLSLMLLLHLALNFNSDGSRRLRWAGTIAFWSCLFFRISQ